MNKPSEKKYDIAVIAPVGGGGTRLYPLTIKRPKPLIYLANRALFQAAVEEWACQGVERFILAPTRENRIPIYDFFKNGEGFSGRIGRDVSFYYTNYDDKGNADAVREAVKVYGKMVGNKHILLINGDNLSNINLDELYQAHMQTGAYLTIAVKELDLDDPILKGFGTVQFDPKTMKVNSFEEKSSSPTSPYANTAICLLSPEFCDFALSDEMAEYAADRIENKGNFDIGRDLIPYLVGSGRDVYAYTRTKEWSDIGTPRSFREATGDILYGLYPMKPKKYVRRYGDGWEAWVHEATEYLMGESLKDVVFKGRNIIGSCVEIAPGSEICDSVLCDNSKIGINGEDLPSRAVDIENTTVMPYARVLNYRLDGCIVGNNTTIDRQAVVNPLAVIGCNLVIPAGISIGTGHRADRIEHLDKVAKAGYKIEDKYAGLFTFRAS